MNMRNLMLVALFAAGEAGKAGVGYSRGTDNRREIRVRGIQHQDTHLDGL